MLQGIMIKEFKNLDSSQQHMLLKVDENTNICREQSVFSLATQKSQLRTVEVIEQLQFHINNHMTICAHHIGESEQRIISCSIDTDYAEETV